MRKILFVCIENAGRSQMAEAFAKKYGKESLFFSSAGTNPAKEINSAVFLAMKEKGIDISDKQPKSLTFDMIKDSDIIITMGCGAKGICVGPTSKPTIDWKLKDPKGKPIVEIREIRDEIELRIKKLLKVQ